MVQRRPKPTDFSHVLVGVIFIALILLKVCGFPIPWVVIVLPLLAMIGSVIFVIFTIGALVVLLALFAVLVFGVLLR